MEEGALSKNKSLQGWRLMHSNWSSLDQIKISNTISEVKQPKNNYLKTIKNSLHFHLDNGWVYVDTMSPSQLK